MQNTNFFRLVKDELIQVNQVLNDRSISDIHLVSQIVNYIILSGGKRIRPIVILLIFNALKMKNNSDIYKLSASIECLHTATLLHDDVVDNSTMRRNKKTSNEIFGNAPSVLVGDFLYSVSFDLLVEIQHLDIMKIVSQATSTIAQSEVFQLVKIGDTKITEEEYLEIIRGKTSILFAAAAKSAVYLSNPQCSSLLNLAYEFGMSIGVAFQILDDILDYEGVSDKLGKNIGDDLSEGKITLPIIQLLKISSIDDKNIVIKIINERLDGRYQEVFDMVKKYKTYEYAFKKASDIIDVAYKYLDSFPQNKYTEALRELAKFTLFRNK